MSASMFPARAGMSRAATSNILDGANVPRASGDEPILPPGVSEH